MKTNAVAGPPASLIFLLQRLLRPLVRLLLAKGFTYPMFADMLKTVYVQVAKDEFTLDGKRQTDSRISLLSGVHRKDIRRLAHDTPAPDYVPSSISLGSQLIARWLTQPAYLDAKGQPLPLPRLASDGGEKSFDALVSALSKDIRPRAVLDEWLRLGVAHLDGQDRVCLNVQGFIPEKGFDEKAFYVGQNVHDHLAAGAHNMLGQTPPFLERSVHSEPLSQTSVEELAHMATDLGMQALQAMVKRAVDLQRKDEGQPGADRRINFGVYFYTERRQD